MGKVYSNQTSLSLRFSTGLDLTDISTATINYNDDNGNSGTWSGAVEAPATAGIVVYNNYNGTLPAGKYRLWLVLTTSGGKTIPSELDYLTLHAEGT